MSLEHDEIFFLDMERWTYVGNRERTDIFFPAVKSKSMQVR